MKSLLSAIKTQLQTSLTYIRDSDIFITPHENYIPHAVRPPCVGIKDGNIQRTPSMGGCVESALTVFIIVFVQMQKDEASIMGDVSTTKKGVLDVCSDIETALNNNLLSLSGVTHAWCASSAQSELFGDERESLQRKILTVIYEKEG